MALLFVYAIALSVIYYGLTKKNPLELGIKILKTFLRLTLRIAIGVAQAGLTLIH